MRDCKITFLCTLICVSLFGFSLQSSAQNSSIRFKVGYTFSNASIAAFDSILVLMNQRNLARIQANELGFSVDNFYEMSKQMRGFAAAITMQNGNSGGEFGILNRSAVSMSDGAANITSSGNYWQSRLKLQLWSVYLGRHYYVVNSDFFKLAPGLSLDFSFLVGSSRMGDDLSRNNYIEKSKSSILSGSSYLNIEFGKSYLIYARPYIQLPFYNSSLIKFEQELTENNNPTTRTKNDLLIKPLNWGITIGFGYGGKI